MKSDLHVVTNTVSRPRRDRRFLLPDHKKANVDMVNIYIQVRHRRSIRFAGNCTWLLVGPLPNALTIPKCYLIRNGVRYTCETGLDV